MNPQNFAQNLGLSLPDEFTIHAVGTDSNPVGVSVGGTGPPLGVTLDVIGDATQPVAVGLQVSTPADHPAEFKIGSHTDQPVGLQR